MDYSIEDKATQIDDIVTTTARYWRMEDSEALHYICKREIAKAKPKSNDSVIDCISRGFSLVRPSMRPFTRSKVERIG
jgi:hypothetical protein